MYTGNPLKNPIDALKLEFGDIDPNYPKVPDSVYEYCLAKYSDSPNRLRRELGMSIAASLTSLVRERSGAEERYGAEELSNYMKWLDKKLNDHNFNGICPIIYVGGVDREIVEYYENNPKFIDETFYKGYSSRTDTRRRRRKSALGRSHAEERGFW